MSLIATLDIALRGDTSNLDRALDASGNAVARFTIKMDQSAAKVNSSTQKMGSKGAGAIGMWSAIWGKIIQGAEMAASAIIGAFTSVDQLARSAQTLGITASALGGLQHAAALAGVGTEEMGHALEKFQKHIAEAASGTGEALPIFAKLGLQAAELKEIPLADALGKVGDALAKTGGAADQLQITLALFGRGAGALKEVLKGGTDGLAQMTEEAKRLGLVLGVEQQQQVQAATLGWRKMSEAITGLSRMLAAVFAPLLKEMADAIYQFMGGSAQAISANIKIWQEWMITVWDMVKAAATIAYYLSPLTWIFSALSGAVGTSEGTWSQWKITLLATLWSVQFTFRNFGDYMILILEKLGLMLLQFGNRVVHTFTVTIPKSIGAFIQLIKDVFSGKADAGERFMQNIRDAIKRDATEFEDGIAADIEKRDKRMKENFAKFMKNKFDEFNKPALAEQVPGRGDLAANIVAKRPAAMEIGSKEAFSVLFGTQDRAQKALNVANDQLKEAKKQVDLLKDLIRKRGVWRVAAF